MSFFKLFLVLKIGKTKSGSVTKIYYKVCQVLQSVTDCYYKVRQVLQSVTSCYYKVRQLLQSET